MAAVAVLDPEQQHAARLEDALDLGEHRALRGRRVAAADARPLEHPDDRDEVADGVANGQAHAVRLERGDVLEALRTGARGRERDAHRRAVGREDVAGRARERGRERAEAAADVERDRVRSGQQQAREIRAPLPHRVADRDAELARRLLDHALRARRRVERVERRDQPRHDLAVERLRKVRADLGEGERARVGTRGEVAPAAAAAHAVGGVFELSDAARAAAAAKRGWRDRAIHARAA